MHFPATVVGESFNLPARQVWSDDERPMIVSGWSTSDPCLLLMPRADGSCDVQGVQAGAGANIGHVVCTYVDPVSGKSKDIVTMVGVFPAGDYAYSPPQFLGVRIQPRDV